MPTQRDVDPKTTPSSDQVTPDASGDHRMLEAYSNFIRQTSWYAHAKEGNTSELSYLALGLGGEAGESVDVVKKMVREFGMGHLIPPATDPKHPIHYTTKLRDEMGDVMWYIVGLCNVLGLTLEDLLYHNTKKLYVRVLELEKFTPEQLDWPFDPKEYPPPDISHIGDPHQ